jgi:ubiquinone biosynthesis protein COQ9
MKAQKSLPDNQKWLSAALKHIPSTGWVDSAITKAAATLGVDNALIPFVFPNGVNDLVQMFHNMVEAETEARIRANHLFPALKIRQKIAFGVKTRLQILAPHRDSVRRLYGWAAMPANTPPALRLLWASADRLWWLAGDTATDYNHYTKRLLLAQLMERTQLFWLNDTSKSHTDTWMYLDERIENVLSFGKQLGQLKDMASLAGAFIKNRMAA